MKKKNDFLLRVIIPMYEEKMKIFYSSKKPRFNGTFRGRDMGDDKNNKFIFNAIENLEKLEQEETKLDNKSFSKTDKYENQNLAMDEKVQGVTQDYIEAEYFNNSHFYYSKPPYSENDIIIENKNNDEFDILVIPDTSLASPTA
jgi:hypothetical protein